MITVTDVPAAQLDLAADVLLRSLERGDWDEDTEEEMSVATGRLRAAARNGTPLTLEEDIADELLGILGSDVRADTGLRELLTALGHALTD